MLFEIHININVQNAKQEIEWILFCESKGWKAIRTINTRGDYTIQTMMGKYCNRDSKEQAIELANELANKITNAGFNVNRVKVESMAISSLYDNLVLDNDPGMYWEFHMKIPTTFDNFEILETTFKNKPKIGFSLSSYGKSKYIICTLRSHTGSRQEFLDYKDQCCKIIKDLGFSIRNKIHFELCVYDTNVELDNNWII